MVPQEVKVVVFPGTMPPFAGSFTFFPGFLQTLVEGSQTCYIWTPVISSDQIRTLLFFYVFFK